MMRTDIYIQSSIRGMERRDGIVGLVVERQTGTVKEPFTQFGRVLSATKNCADLLGLKNALKHADLEDWLYIHLDNNYIVAAIKHDWLGEWWYNGWKTSKGRQIANMEEWQAVAILLNNRKPEFRPGAHKYKRWLETELARRAKKYD